MRMKSFTGRSLPDAMKRVREALGPDAVILSTQPSEDGSGVRVTAALEDAPLDDFTAAPQDGGLQAVDAISETLGYHRVPPRLFDRLIGNAAAMPAADPVMVLAGALDAEFSFAPLPEDPASRPIMLVGLPGAGKTASAAKLCVRARMAGRQATIITMDTVKSGGLAQVQAFAQAMQARLEPAPDLDTLATAVENSAGNTFTVIDTVGTNPFDDAAMHRLMGTARAIGAALTFVLAAGGDAADSAEAAIAFREIGATRLVGTRLDTARRFGGLLSAAQAGRLALAAVSTSPEISDGLSGVNPVSLARLLAPQDAAAWCNEPVGESA